MINLSKMESLLERVDLMRLAKTRVALFGLGGVGGYVLEGLARCGVGTFYLIDGDVIEETNINRQLLALRSTIGKKKVDVARQRVLDINEDAIVHTLFEMVSPKADYTLSLSLLDDVDIIIDATDDIPLKVALALEGERREIFTISSGGTANRLDASSFEIVDIYKTKNCPLTRILREKLKKLKVKHLDVLCSSSPPLIKGVVSSVSWVPSIAGLMIAGYVVEKIVQKSERK